MKAKIIPTLNVEITLTLTEGEAGCLQAISGYGHKAFTEVFCKHMGQHYIAPHIGHLESLFDKFNKLNSVLEDVYKVRQQLPKGVVIK